MLGFRCRASSAISVRFRAQASRIYTVQSRGAYDETLRNLKIGKDTRVIFQGITGRQATANAEESLRWGTKIVGGVTPKKEGEHLGLPVLPTVRRAVEELKPDATGIYVAAHQAPAAIEEAIEAEIPLIVAVAEHIPLHDILRIHQILRTQSKSRLVGANAPGIISAIGYCRIGFQPLSTFSPGNVGVVAKSGTLSYEAVASLTQAGLGQSLCIGMGGDVVAGTDFVDALRVFEIDEDTKGIVLIGEVGGTAEEEAADWINDYRKRVQNPKPIAALVGGMCAKEGKVMGHAGAWAAPGEGSAQDKYSALERAGVTMVDHPEKFGPAMRKLMVGAGLTSSTPLTSAAQKRGYHTLRQRPTAAQSSRARQRRSLHLRPDQSAALLKEFDIQVGEPPSSEADSRLLVMTVARSERSPCLVVSPTVSPTATHQRALHIPFSYADGPSKAEIQTATTHLQLDTTTARVQAALISVIQNLYTLFRAREAISLSLRLCTPPDSSTLLLYNPILHFDDAAFTSAARHEHLHSLRDTSLTDPTELAAEPAGIVYVRLTSPPGLSHSPTPPPPQRNIGTLVNGAGLAMNTVDALAARGGLAANFLDTGGKATAETVRRAFALLLADPRVRVVFVNIFGGLTRGDMIAEGVVSAVRELSVELPVVVRIRGTREEEGMRVIAESGLRLEAFERFEDAAGRVIELAAEAEG